MFFEGKIIYGNANKKSGWQNYPFMERTKNGKNELEDILQIVWEFFNLKTQYPGPLFDSGFLGLNYCGTGQVSRKASRLGYLLFKFTPKCGMLLFVKPFFLMPTWLTKATTNVQNCIRKNFRLFLTRMYLFILKYKFFLEKVNKQNATSISKNLLFVLLNPKRTSMGSQIDYPVRAIFSLKIDKK